jgi:hypothetical protein
MNFETILLSYPTYVPRGSTTPTGAATYQFFTKGYHPPEQARSIESDIVHNQNGKFKYIYDNGPGFKRWSPFEIRCENAFATYAGIGTALQQFNNLKAVWEKPGTLTLQAPEGIYTVNWGDSLERNFKIYPKKVGAIQEFEVTVQFEEAS